MPKFRALTLAAAALLIAGCGGGGGGGGADGGAGDGPALSAALAVLPPSANAIAAPAQNVLPISVESGPAGGVNLAYATITICAPGSSANCQTIDHVLVDTASTGLRIMSSALSPALGLPQQVDANGNPVAECTQFASGYSWGPIKLADVNMAGKQASSLAIQVIADSAFAPVPLKCAGTGASMGSLHDHGVNAILGLSVFRHDCGSACALSAGLGVYHACPASGCQEIAMPLADQLQNPAAALGADNNGIIVQLPSIAEAGAAGVRGALVFGIGTQANNGLGSASVLAVDAATGRITTIYKNRNFPEGVIDSASNALFFFDPDIPVCTGTAAAGFYCPASTQSLTATLQAANGNSVRVDFSVANAEALRTNNPSFSALSGLASPSFFALGFDWGLPFFFGRNVFVAFEGANTPGGFGPYFAF